MECEKKAPIQAVINQKKADPAVEDEVDLNSNIRVRGLSFPENKSSSCKVRESKTNDVPHGGNLQTEEDVNDIYLTPESRRRLCPTDDTGETQDNACSEHPEKDVLEKIKCKDTIDQDSEDENIETTFANEPSSHQKYKDDEKACIVNPADSETMSLKQGDNEARADANKQFSHHQDDEKAKFIKEQACVGIPARSNENDSDSEAEVADGTTSDGKEQCNKKMTGSGKRKTSYWRAAKKVSNRMGKPSSPTLLYQDEEGGNTTPDEVTEAYLNRGQKNCERWPCHLNIFAIVMAIFAVVATGLLLMHKETNGAVFPEMCVPCQMLENSSLSNLLNKLSDNGSWTCCANNFAQRSALFEIMLEGQVNNETRHRPVVRAVSAHKRLLPGKESAHPNLGFQSRLLSFNPTDNEPAEHANGVNVTKNACIILHSSDYFVYLDVYIRPNVSTRDCLTYSNLIVRANVKLRRRQNTVFTNIMEVTHTGCCNCGVDETTKFIGRAIQLQTGDQLMVFGPGTEWMDFEKESSFFGLFRRPPEVQY